MRIGIKRIAACALTVMLFVTAVPEAAFWSRAAEYAGETAQAETESMQSESGLEGYGQEDSDIGDVSGIGKKTEVPASSEPGNADEGKPSEPGNADEEKPSEPGNGDEEKSSEPGNGDEEKSSGSGNIMEEKSADGQEISGDLKAPEEVQMPEEMPDVKAQASLQKAAAGFQVSQNGIDEIKTDEDEFFYRTPEAEFIPGAYVLIDEAFLERFGEAGLSEEILSLDYPVYAFGDFDENGVQIGWKFRVYGSFEERTGFYECDGSGKVDGDDPVFCGEEGAAWVSPQADEFTYMTPTAQELNEFFFYTQIDGSFMEQHSELDLAEELLTLGYPVFAFEEFADGAATGRWHYRVFGKLQQTGEESGFYSVDKSGIVDSDNTERCDFEHDNALRGKEVGGVWMPDSGIVTKADYLTDPRTGIAPFDEEGEHECYTDEYIRTAEGAGRDCCRQNDILRVGDLATFSLQITMGLNEGESGTVQAAKYASLKGGKVYFEAVIPEVEGADFIWDTASITDIKLTDISADKKTIKGYYTLSDQEITVPGSALVNLFMKLESGKNGERVTVVPEYTVYMEGNQHEDESIAEGKDKYEAVKKAEPLELLISSRSAYNVKVSYHTAWDSSWREETAYEWKQSEEEHEGLELAKAGDAYVYRGYQFHSRIYMDSRDEEKGMKGMEIPEGPMSYDIHIKITDQSTGENVTDKLQPLLTVVTGIGNNKVGQAFGAANNAVYSGVNGFYGTMGTDMSLPCSYTNNAAASPVSAVYNSGYYTITNDEGIMNRGDSRNYTMELEGSGEDVVGTFHVSVDDYEVRNFPTQTWRGDKISSSIGYLSLAEFCISIPGVNNRQYQVQIWDDNMSITSQSGTVHQNENQTNKADDSITFGHKVTVNMGSLNVYKENNVYRGGSVNASLSRTTRTFLGETLEFESIFRNISTKKGNYDPHKLRTLLNLSKFDGSLYEPTGYIRSINTRGGTYRKALWAAKKDGSNWSSYEEMELASIEDLVYYDSLEELKASGKICVGVLAESSGDDLFPGGGSTGNFYYQVRPVNQTAANILGYDEAVSGGDVINPVNTDGRNRSQICNTVLAWKEELSPEQFSRADGNVPSYAAFDESGAVTYVIMPDVNLKGAAYTPYTFGQGGTVKEISSDTNRRTATSFCILGIESSVKTYLETPGKTAYNISEGEDEVPIRIAPSIKSQAEGIVTQESKTDVTVTVTLPAGLTYVPGSSWLGGSYSTADKTVEGGERFDPEITRNDKGQYVLTWIYRDVYYGQELEQIHYKVKVDPETKNGTNFSLPTRISCPEDQRPYVDRNDIYGVRYWSVGFQAVVKAENRLYETNRQPLVEREEELGFHLIYKNASALVEWDDMKLYTLLPFNGDWRGTSYQGSYTLGDINLTVSEGTAVGAQLFYTTQKDLQNAGSESAFFDRVSADSVSWIPAGEKISGKLTEATLANAGEIPADAVALRVVFDNIGGGAKCRIELNIRPSENQAYDVYGSSCSIRSDEWATEGGLTRIVSADSEITVLQRSLSGRVFLDGNHDGIRQLTGGAGTGEEVPNQYTRPDELVAGAKVSLEYYDSESGAYIPAKDVAGQSIKEVITGEDGAYAFHNLPAGTFRVKVESELMPYMEVTHYRQGNNKAVDSDAAVKTTEEEKTSRYAYINDIRMPASADVLVQHHQDQNEDVGLYYPGEIRVTKILREAASGRLDLSQEAFVIALYDAQGKKLAQDTLEYNAANDSFQKKNKDGSFSDLVFQNLPEGTYEIREIDELGNEIAKQGIYYYRSGEEKLGKYTVSITPDSLVLTQSGKSAQSSIVNKEEDNCLLAICKEVTGYNEGDCGNTFTAKVSGLFYRVDQNGSVDKQYTERAEKTVVFKKQQNGTYLTEEGEAGSYVIADNSGTGGDTATIPGLILGQNYTVTEIPTVLADGKTTEDYYRLVSMEIEGRPDSRTTQNGLVVTAQETPQTVVITNTRKADAAELTIRKDFDYDGGETLNFILTGPIPPLNTVPGIQVLQDTKDITDLVTIDREKGTISIPYDQSRGILKVTGLFADASYQVNEQATISYIPEKTVQTAVPGETVTFNNARNREAGIVIRKIFADGFDDGQTLTFTVTGHMPETVSVNGTEAVPEKTGKNGKLTVAMDAYRPDLVITGLYDKAEYTVEEADAEGYKSAKPVNVTAHKASDESVQESIAVFENYRKLTGELVIRKTFTNYDGGESLFFTITGKMPEIVVVDGKAAAASMMKEGSGMRSLTVELTGDRRKNGVKITGLFLGSELLVTEQTTAHYEKNTQRIQVKAQEKAQSADFVNTRKTANLTICKKFMQNSDQSDTLYFTITGAFPEDYGQEQIQNASFESLKKNVLTVSYPKEQRNKEIVLEGLYEGCTYQVKERDDGKYRINADRTEVTLQQEADKNRIVVTNDLLKKEEIPENGKDSSKDSSTSLQQTAEKTANLQAGPVKPGEEVSRPGRTATGDTTNVLLYAVLMAAAAVGAGILLFRKKGKKG